MAHRKTIKKKATVEDKAKHTATLRELKTLAREVNATRGRKLEREHRLSLMLGDSEVPLADDIHPNQ